MKPFPFWLLSLALAARVAWWAAYVRVIENEGAEYARIAQNWLAGDGYVGLFGGTHVLFPPLYPGLIGLGTVLGDDGELTGRLISMLCGLLLVLTLFALSRRIWGPRVAVAAGLLAALHPVLVATSVSVYSESLAMCLVTGAAYFTVTAPERPWLYAAAAGAAVGLAYLTRPETIVFLGVVAGALLAAGRRGGERWSRVWRAPALACSVALVIGLPYVVHLSRLSGRPRWEGKSAANEVLNERLATGMPYAEAARGLGPPPGPYLEADQSVLLRAPGRAPRLYIAGGHVLELARFTWWAAFMGGPALYVVALVGMLSAQWWRSQRVGGALLLSLLAVQGVFLLALQFTWSRFLFPVLPLLVPWFAAGLDRLSIWVVAIARRLAEPHRDLAIRTLSAAGIIALCGVALPATRAVAEFAQARDTDVKVAGEWIREHADTGGRGRALVMGYGSAVPFYGGATLSYLPYSTAERALRYVHEKAPDFVVVQTVELHQTPYFSDWLKDGIGDECAREAFIVGPPDAPRIRIWRWTCRA